MDYKKDLRIALFAHAVHGTDSIKYMITIMRALAKRRDDVSIMLVTGCGSPGVLRGLPPNSDLIKIPTITAQETSRLRLSPAVVTQLRRRIIKEAVISFTPDVFVVGDSPFGFNPELLPLFKALKSMPTKSILGLQDVPGTPEAVRSNWKVR